MAFTFVGSLRSALILLVVFVVGGVLMGFEMLGSRFLYPYFGGGIGTWAALISTVLYALAIGYFAGGALVDRYPSPMVYLVGIPTFVDGVMQAILDSYGYGMGAVLLAAALLLALPVGLLGMLSPAAVRLLLRQASSAGQVAGAVYGVSAVGNVTGILLTTFALIPSIGSHAITYCFALALTLCGTVLILGCPREALAKSGIADRARPAPRSEIG